MRFCRGVVCGFIKPVSLTNRVQLLKCGRGENMIESEHISLVMNSSHFPALYHFHCNNTYVMAFHSQRFLLVTLCACECIC